MAKSVEGESFKNLKKVLVLDIGSQLKSLFIPSHRRLKDPMKYKT
jgi:hypothetical protein